MSVSEKIREATTGKFIFPVEIWVSNSTHNNGRFALAESNYSKLNELSREKNFFNQKVFDAYVNLIENFLENIGFTNGAKKENVYFNGHIFTIFLPEDFSVAQKLFSETQKIVEKICEEKNLTKKENLSDEEFFQKKIYTSIIFNVLLSGFPIYGETSIKPALLIIKKHLTKKIQKATLSKTLYDSPGVQRFFLQKGNMINPQDPMVNFDEEQKFLPSQLSTVFKTFFAMEIPDVSYRNEGNNNFLFKKTILKISEEKLSQKAIFNQVLNTVPFFIALKNFILHGDNNQTVKDFIYSEKGQRIIRESFTNGSRIENTLIETLKNKLTQRKQYNNKAFYYDFVLLYITESEKAANIVFNLTKTELIQLINSDEDYFIILTGESVFMDEKIFENYVKSRINQKNRAYCDEVDDFFNNKIARLMS